MRNRSIYSWLFGSTWEFALESAILVLIMKDRTNIGLAFALSLGIFFHAIFVQLRSYCLLTNRKRPWDWLCFSSKQKTFDLLQKAAVECLQNEDCDLDRVKRYLRGLMLVTTAIYIFSLFFLLS